MPPMSLVVRQASPPLPDNYLSTIGLSLSLPGLTVNTAPSESAFDPTASLDSPATSLFKAGQEATEIGSQATDHTQNTDSAKTHTFAEESQDDSDVDSGADTPETANAGKEQMVWREIARGTVEENVDAATQQEFKRTLKRDGYTENESAPDPRADGDLWCYTRVNRGIIFGVFGAAGLCAILVVVHSLHRIRKEKRKIGIREAACIRTIRDTDAACFSLVENLNLEINDSNDKVKVKQRRIDDYEKNPEDMASMEKEGKEMKETLADQERDIQNFQGDNEGLRRRVHAESTAKKEALAEIDRLRVILDGLKKES